jgi:death-on-curing family protein
MYCDKMRAIERETVAVVTLESFVAKANQGTLHEIMSRGRVRLSELIDEAGIDSDAALLSLLDSDLEVRNTDEFIPKSKLARVRKFLALPRQPSNSQLEIRTLAIGSGKTEAEVRDRLFEAGLIEKRRLKFLPRTAHMRAQEVLGLRKSPQAIAISLARKARKAAAPRKIKKDPTWRRIGPPQDLTFLVPSDVYQLHCVLVEDFLKSKDPIEPPGVRSEALLDSAVHRPKTSLGLTDKYPTVAMAGAALVHSLVLDHPFHNGNKRTAIVALLAFLDRNSWVLTASEDEIYNILLELAQHKLVDEIDDEAIADREVLHLAAWLQSHIRKVVLKEYPLQFRHLRRILEHFDCRLEFRPGGRIHIYCGSLHTQLQYKTEGADVEKTTIHTIRRALEFDDEHGYDSDIFYNFGPRIPEFINKYRRLLDRLAKI